MLNFNFCSPTRFIFGKGVESQAGEQLKALSAGKALVVYGGGSAVRSGLIARVVASLEAAGIAHLELGGAKPNPRSDLVYEGIALARKNGVDCLLAVGGGSAIDTAKAIATGTPYEGDFWDFFCGKALPKTALPVGVVLTLAAAGSEGSNSCVITNTDGMYKRGLGHELNRPRFALLNPELTYTLPPFQTACGAADMMAHVLERYFTNEPDVDITDRLCEAVLGAIVKAAPVALAKSDDYNARAQLMWAGTLAHNESCGVGRLGDWSCHQIEHELSALYDVAHGAGLAVVYPAWMRFQLDHDVMRFARLAVNLWGCEMDFAHPEKTALEGVNRFEAFLRGLGLPVTLRELGARAEDIPALAAKVKRNNGDKVGFFRPLSTADVEAVLRLADK